MSTTPERLRVTLRPSRTLAVFLITAYAGAAGCLAAIGLPDSLSLPLLALLGMSACCDLRAHVCVSSRSRLCALILDSTGEFVAFDTAGRAMRGTPATVRLVHPLAVSFSLYPDQGRPVAVLVLADMTSAEEFRALRVWLRGQGKAHPLAGLS